MSKLIHVHWLFKEEPTHAEHHLCDFPRAARDAEHSIVLRPRIRQKPGGRLRECVRCAKIGNHTMEHGGTIVEVVPSCSVHLLHLVKVRASGSRSGCPMCEMQIEALCHSFTRPPDSTLRDHATRITLDRMRIVGCTCDWRTPPGTTDSDDAYSEHVTVMR